MEIGLGHLGWTPGTFWSATFPEFRAAVDGYIVAVGGKGSGGSRTTGGGARAMTARQRRDLKRFTEVMGAMLPSSGLTDSDRAAVKALRRARKAASR